MNFGGKWGDRRESNSLLRGHNPALCPLSYGHSADDGSRTRNGARFELACCTIRKRPRFGGLATRRCTSSSIQFSRFRGRVRIRTPDFRPYRFSRPALEPVQLTLPNIRGGSGIRTHGPLFGVSRFPSVRLKPLGHPSVVPGRAACSARPCASRRGRRRGTRPMPPASPRR